MFKKRENVLEIEEGNLLSPTWKYGHLRAAKTGLLDTFFAAYIPYEDQGMGFFDWVETVYDPDALAANFMAQRWAVRLTDTILRRE